MSETGHRGAAADARTGGIRERRVWLPALALLLLGLALYLPRLGASGLWDPWEPRYAQAAREMAAADNWIVPHYRLGPRLNKPPMTYWLIGASHSVLGVNETAARLPSALLAVLCPVLLGLAFAARRRPLEGFMAGAALLTFRAPHPGIYRLTCGYPEGHAGIQMVLGVGEGLLGDRSWSILGALALAFVPAAFGVGIGVATVRARELARKRFYGTHYRRI